MSQELQRAHSDYGCDLMEQLLLQVNQNGRHKTAADSTGVTAHCHVTYAPQRGLQLTKIWIIRMPINRLIVQSFARMASV